MDSKGENMANFLENLTPDEQKEWLLFKDLAEQYLWNYKNISPKIRLMNRYATYPNYQYRVNSIQAEIDQIYAKLAELKKEILPIIPIGGRGWYDAVSNQWLQRPSP